MGADCKPNSCSQAGYTWSGYDGKCWTSCASNLKESYGKCYTYFIGRFGPILQTYKYDLKSYDMPIIDGGNLGCDAGYYNSYDGLCYQDCKNAAMVNCGVNACAADVGTCNSNIINMVLSVLVAIADTIIFIVSFGTAGAATKSISQAVKDAGQVAVDVATTLVKNIAKDATAVDKIISFAIKSVKAAFISEVEAAITDTCRGIGVAIFANVVSKTTPVSYDFSSFDPTGVSGAIIACTGDRSDPNFGINCAKAVVGAISNVDPTGILAAVSTFMAPTCPVAFFPPYSS